MKGYLVESGYIGFLPNGKKMLFTSEADYIDYYLAFLERR